MERYVQHARSPEFEFRANRWQIFKYHEKPFAQKLDILYQRNLYVLAINLAQKAGLDSSQQNVILRKFGDYLYSKQDYDTAMQQYLKAIDNTEPSQVIRKVCERQLYTNLELTSASSWILIEFTT
jgi:tetratricopeptide (TPR) repeat protein